MIRRLRKAQKMSQEILAGKLQVAGLNLNQKSISRIETGKRVVPDYELIYFSEVLNVPITALFETNKK
jgi:transcriptional regulator with XRE-family HTH domain